MVQVRSAERFSTHDTVPGNSGIPRWTLSQWFELGFLQTSTRFRKSLSLSLKRCVLNALVFAFDRHQHPTIKGCIERHIRQSITQVL